MLRLIVEKGEPAGAVFELAPGETILGRSRSAACRLLASDVSAAHAVIRVTDNDAHLENLSQFGTQVDGVSVSEKVVLTPGQRIAIGRATVLRVDEDGGASDMAIDDDTTVTSAVSGGSDATPTAMGAPIIRVAGTTVPITGEVAVPAPTARPQPAAAPVTRVAARDAGATRADDADFSEITRSMAGVTSGGEDEEGATRAMQTRAATPEEIDHLLATERKRTRRRVSILLTVMVPGVILALLLWPRPPPPETEIEWPKDAAGTYLDLFEPAPSGGFKEEGFDVCYPANGTFAKRAIEGGMVFEGRVGRKTDVPMRVILQEERETRFVGMTRDAVVADWMERVASGDGHWNFDRPSPTPSFLGRKNGVPYVRVTYLRDGGGSWFGVASIVRRGSRRIVARTEVPATERVRAEKMMSAKLIRPSSAFEHTHWEGPGSATPLDEAATLRQIRAELERTAPATWVALEKLLQNVLAQATQAGHDETETRAMVLLARLRERQSLYFNSQKLAFDAAMMQNNRNKAAKIAEFTKAVFSNIDDQRYLTVRKWRMEP